MPWRTVTSKVPILSRLYRPSFPTLDLNLKPNFLQEKDTTVGGTSRSYPRHNKHH